MTRKEAIEIFKNMLDAWDNYYTIAQSDKKREAVWLAIKALEQEPTTKNDLGVDLISRADVLKLMQDNWHTHNGDWAMQESIDAIREMPSVTPQEPRKGHWIPTYGNVKCSVCGSVKDSRDVGKATHYCDFCGARMVEPQESEG